MSITATIRHRVNARPWIWSALLLLTLIAPSAVWWYFDSRAGARPLSIAVAPLEHDQSGEYRDLIVEAIREFPNARLVRTGRIAPDLEPRDAAGRAGHDAAHERLTKIRADAVIWGSVHREGDETRVKLMWTASPDLPVQQDFGRYQASEDLSFPPLLWSDLNPVLRLLVATYAVDVRGLDAEAAANAFFPFVVPVYDTLAQPSEGAWSAMPGARIAQVLANALFRYAEQTDQPELLEEAIDAYRDVLAAHARWQQPLDWARAESRLGAALAELGERSSDPARLETAVDAFRAALWEQTPEHTPLEWARTQIHLGHALTAQGARKERDVSAARLEEAVVAYRTALTPETRERMPLTWAVAQNNLGSVLKALGDLNADTKRTEEAVSAYRAALTVETRTRMPLQWATVQSNLASALARLGEARSDQALLTEAVTAYRAALKERSRDEMPLAWAATQNNLGNALRMLGQIQSGTAQLKQAADAYTAALVEFTRAKSEPHIETTKRNLERTMKALNDREQS